MAGQAVGKGSDAYLFLNGMMLLSHFAREQDIFDWVASVAVHGANGSCSRLFLLAYSVGTLVTILMSNDATAVVLTPAILSAVREAKVSPLPYLFVCATHRECGELCTADFEPGKSGGLSYWKAASGEMATRLRLALSALDLGDVCRHASAVSQ